MADYFRLDPTTIAEPLVNSWYAWVNYLSPPCLAMYAKKLHAEILEGYFNDVNLIGYHTISASQFNKLQKEKELSKIKSKLQKTYENYQTLIKLADQIDECYKVFISNNLYYESLSSAYKMIPLELRGMVELSYDLHNRIHIRFIEELFYQSKFYEKKLQSILLFKSQSYGRPLYFLNIPQYCGRNELEIKIPFENTVHDLIFECRCKPITMKKIDLIYARYLDKKIPYKNFKDFFVKTKLSKKNKDDNIDEHFSIQYMGHACLLIKCGNITILIDLKLEIFRECHIMIYLKL